MPNRSFRWMLLALAVVSLGLDLGSKYGVFRWLYNGEKSAREGPFESWVMAKHWREGTDLYVPGGRYNFLPGWMGLTAEYQVTDKPNEETWLNALQTWSTSPKQRMPHVNQGALFGIGGNPNDPAQSKRANSIFTYVSFIAAIAILVWGLQKHNASDCWLCCCLGLILGGTLGNLYDRMVFGGVRDFLYFYKFEWPVFNIADCCLVLGAGMLCIQAFFAPNKDAAKNAPASVPAAC
jgi:lipoprotein signal peptidase